MTLQYVANSGKLSTFRTVESDRDSRAFLVNISILLVLSQPRGFSPPSQGSSSGLLCIAAIDAGVCVFRPSPPSRSSLRIVLESRIQYADQVEIRLSLYGDFAIERETCIAPWARFFLCFAAERRIQRIQARSHSACRQNAAG